MSDAPMGEGWWQASNGRWYAPEKHPDARRQSVTAGAPGWIPPTEPVAPVVDAGTWTGARTGYAPAAVRRSPRRLIMSLVVLLIVAALAVAAWIVWRIVDSDESILDAAVGAPPALLSLGVAAATS